MKNRNKARLLKAEKLLNLNQLKDAIIIFNDLLLTEPNNTYYLSLRGESLLRSEQYESALIDLAKAVELDSKNIITLNNFAVALLRCNRSEDAKNIFNYILELDNNNFDAYINLCNIYQSKYMYAEALRAAFKAVEIRPKSAVAFNNLGTALGDMQLVVESQEAFKTALVLEKDYIPSLINLAQVEEKLENRRETIRLYEQLLNIKGISKDQSELVKYYLSYSYLYYGNLQKGWIYYDYGFGGILPIGAIRSLRKFDQPRWAGENDSKKTLLLWREQGLGDEIDFLTCLDSVVELVENVILECDARLVPIYQRMYPSLVVRPPMVDNLGSSLASDFDFQLPIGSLPRYFRPNIDSFNCKVSNFSPLQPVRNDFVSRISKYQDKLLIGISWRSGLLQAHRNQHYTGLRDWVSLLLNPNFQFVNLQYGECESEIQEIENELNIKILRWDDLDLKNDLEGVIALIDVLDCVVSVGTAVSSLAGAVGKKTYLLTKRSWLFLGESDQYPWYKSIVPLIAESNEMVANKIVSLESLLDLDWRSKCLS